MRFNIVDPAGTVSFIGPAHLVKVLAASCARNPTDLGQLLTYSERYDSQLRDFVLNGLAVFDEHNSEQDHAAFDAALPSLPPDASPPFRVVSAATEEASLAPVGAGLVIYNLPAKRIVQVQNSYSNVLRQDRGRIRVGGEPTERLYHYKLPTDWRLVP